MMLNLFVLAVTGFVTYMWIIRGFFSALIHLVCTVIAGAVAFGVWEPVSYWLLESAPASGVGSHLTGMAWGVGLLVPFALTLGILRLVVDKMLPANVVLSAKFNYAGGGVCGLLAGVLTGGIVAMGLGHFRTGPDFGTPIRFVNGNPKRDGGLWLPIDKMTGAVYSSLSERAFRTSEPLAKWHPAVHEEGGTLQWSFEGKNRNTTRLSDFEVIGRFNVGENGKAKFSTLTRDMWHEGGQAIQKVYDLDGNPFPEGTNLEGIVVKFKPEAKDKSGKFSVGAAQVNLVLENDDGDRKRVHPIAVSSQAQSDKPVFGRWWLDAGAYIASVGAAADTIFAFEFPCPPGYKPIAIYVKGARRVIEKKPDAIFRSSAERDGAIASAFISIGNVAPVADLDLSAAVPAERVKGSGQGAAAPLAHVNITEMLPFIIQKGTHDLLEIDEEGDRNIIINGELKLNADSLNSSRGIDRKLEIKRLLVAPDQVIVQIDTSAPPYSLLNKVFVNQETNDVPTLYDQNNVPYVPVGWAYQDESILWMRYTPGNPITKFDQLPPVSASRSGQKLTLIYRVSKGVSLKHYGCGKKITVTIDPPFLLDMTQGQGR
jgi:uncharacterized membrane protein required for colicin V production